MTARPARRRFAQHFLRDSEIVEKIVAAFDPRADDRVVEIGPGQGVLTRALLAKVAGLHAIEIDRDLVLGLRHALPDSVTLHNADILHFDLCSLDRLPAKLRIIGNLPYNISTPILFRLLEQIQCIDDMLFMLQREVVDRIAAAPGGKDYGRLSVMVQWRLRAEKLFDVPPEAFRPQPKVNSSVLRLVPYDQPPVVVNDPKRFAAIVQAAFGQRRKMLRNTLKGMIAVQTMESLGIDPARRPETLSLAEFAALANG